MSQPLLPCPSCQRHVFADACTCPFCATRLRVCDVARAAAPGGNLSRAARLAAGAALVGAAACSSTSTIPPYGAPPMHDASADIHADAGAGGAGGADTGGVAGGADGGGAGGASAPADAGTDRGAVPIYGAAAPVQRKPVP